jgi:hypothetical protein
MLSAPGERIIVASWAGNVVFAATAVPAALGLDALDTAAIVTELVLFMISIVVWMWAFGVAMVRSAQGDEIVVSNLFLVQGDVPRRVRVQLFSSLAVALVIAAGTAVADPFGVLVPMLPLAFAGLWGARHGQFPARRDTAS